MRLVCRPHEVGVSKAALQRRRTRIAIAKCDWLTDRLLTIIDISISISPKQVHQSLHIKLPAADPGFPQGGAPTPQGGANIPFCQIFPKTAWNWKNLGARGGGRPCTPPKSATGYPLLTAHIRSMGKVISSQASVILSTGEGCIQDVTQTDAPPPRPGCNPDGSPDCTRRCTPLDAPPGWIHPPPPGWMYPPEDRRSTGGRYASYWNVYFFWKNLIYI